MKLGTRDLTEPTLVGSVTVIAFLGVWAELHYATTHVPPAVGAYALTAGAAASLLLLRRQGGIAAGVICLLLCYLYRALGYPGFAPAVLVFVVCYTLASMRGLIYGIVPAVIAWIIPALPPHPLPLLESAVAMPAVSMAITALVGESARRRRFAAQVQLRDAAATAEARAGRRMAEERLRIARELHDVLAHTISVVAVQSGLALDALDDSPEQAREALLAVRGAAKQAIPELRAALDLLRGGAAQDADGPAPEGVAATRVPQPGLDELADLVRQARDAGLDVRLTWDQDLREASPLLQLTAYRIVQESLTNVRKHAGAEARAEVSLRRDQDVVRIDVRDDGAGLTASTSAAPSAGFGLLGMRERAEALGGEVAAGPDAAGGFCVRASLPWITAPVAGPGAAPDVATGPVERATTSGRPQTENGEP